MSNPIKIGIVGLGRIGMTIHRDAYAAHPDKYTVVAACDLIESRTQKFADKFGCRTNTNIEDFLADPEIEIVDIATRSSDHYAHAKMALLAGKRFSLRSPSVKPTPRLVSSFCSAVSPQVRVFSFVTTDALRSDSLR